MMSATCVSCHDIIFWRVWLALSFCTFAVANEKDIEQHSVLGGVSRVVCVVAAAHVDALLVQ